VGLRAGRAGRRCLCRRIEFTADELEPLRAGGVEKQQPGVGVHPKAPDIAERREKARKIMEGMGGLNGFQFGPDGKLYGPLWFNGEVARVDVDAATIETVASGFGVPAAANFGPDGALYVLDTLHGEVVRVVIDTGEKTVVAAVRTGLDNLDFDANGKLYVTGMAEAAIFDAINTHNIDLVVMGTAARGGFQRFLVVNTAERILPELPCSGLAVKPADFVCPLAPQ